MKQIKLIDWPCELTEEVAVIRQLPEQLEKEGLAHFEETFDDLDYFKAAIIYQDEFIFALKRYRNCGSQGTSIWITRGSAEHINKSIDSVLHVLGLPKSALTWIREVKSAIE